MKKALSVFLFLLVMNTVQAQDTLNAMKWLVGTWKGLYQEKPFYEAWHVVNDSTLLNLAIEIKGKDTLVQESSALMKRQGKWKLGDQKFSWSLKRIMPNEVMLENDTARFSNRIIWLHTSDDHWFTILQNPKSTVYYDMVRAPEVEAVVRRYINHMSKRK